MPTATINDVRYALRGFRRAPLVALTVVSTVALGLGLVAVAFTVFNTVLFREDTIPRVGEMYAVEGPRTSDGERAGFTRPQLESLHRDAGVFTGVYGEMSGIDVRVDGRLLLFTLATGNFFEVAGVKPALGRALTPEDDQPGRERTVAVLSDRGWERLFGRDPRIVGRTIQVNGAPFEIVGVMPRDFRGLAIISPDYWVPLATVGHLRPAYQGREASMEVRAVGRLKPGMSRETALAGLAVWASGLPSAPGSERATSGITLLPWRGTVPETMDAVAVTGPLFVAFGLILVIGCANVTNLLLARAVSRQREIGIRLSLGAARRRIVRQLMTESLLLALLAAAAGFAISRLTLEVIIRAVMASWPPEIGNIHLVVPEADWRVALFLLAGAGVSTLSFALFPALQASRVEPIAMMRGEVLRQTRPGRARGLLIGLQVGVSTLLLISATVFLRSALAATVDDSGMRTTDSVTIGIANEAIRTAAIQALAAEPLVATVAASRPAAIAAPQSGLTETGGAKTAIAYRFVSPEYFAVLDVRVTRGRPFASDERSPALPIAVVSETAARTLWPDRDPLGQVLRLERDPAVKSGTAEPLTETRLTVVGVARDVAGFRIAPFAKAVVYIPADTAMPGTALTARVHGDPELARRKLLERLGPVDGKSYELGTTGWVASMETYLLSLAFWMTVALGALGTILTVSGLFSVLSYVVEQRTREIGVRMALGATTRDVAALVLRQSLRPVGIGLVLGGTTAAALSKVLLSTAAAGAVNRLVQVLDPVAYAAGLLIILAACVAAASIPATRATRVDPMQTLRTE
jgi:predicted permease